MQIFEEFAQTEPQKAQLQKEFQDDMPLPALTKFKIPNFLATKSATKQTNMAAAHTHTHTEGAYREHTSRALGVVSSRSNDE